MRNLTRRSLRYVGTLTAVLVAASCAEDMDTDDIDEVDEVAELRGAVIKHFWGADGAPTLSQPDEKTLDVSEPIFRDLVGVAQVDRIRFEHDVDLRSVSELYRPATPATELVIYYEGHCPTFCTGTPGIIEFFVARGYAVLLHAMPHYGPNMVQPRVKHNEFVAMQEEAGVPNPLRWFMEGVWLSLNHIEQAYDYTRISMLGLSGGGWATTLYAGIDTRVQLSFPVSGSVPFHMRNVSSDVGDAEQLRERPVYDVATYLDFYRLAAAGAGRRHIQIFNHQDPCCFAADGREDIIAAYERDITDKLTQAGDDGAFVVAIVTDHNGHEVSAGARALIAAEISRAAAAD